MSLKEVELWGETPPRVLTVGQKVETVAIYVVVADGAGGGLNTAHLAYTPKAGGSCGHPMHGR